MVPGDEWRNERIALLQKEKALSHQIDEVSRLRRELSWVEVTKPYRFTGPDGSESLSDLFGKNSQLITYHFMYAPGWDEGCVGCSFLADHIDGVNLHLAHHDVTLLAVSRAPFDEFQAFKSRMGWKFKWVSSAGSDFSYDYHASFKRAELDSGDVDYNYKLQKLQGEDAPGTIVFYKDSSGKIFHTYSSYERGGDILLGVNNYLDLTPKGRNENGGWWQLHDEYGDA